MATYKTEYTLVQALLVAANLTLACAGSSSEESAPAGARDKERGQDDGGAPILAPPPRYGNRVAALPDK